MRHPMRQALRHPMPHAVRHPARHTRLVTAFVSAAAVMTAGLAAAPQATAAKPAAAPASAPAPASGPALNSARAAHLAAVPDPGVTKPSGKWCTYTKWGGTFYCKSQLKHKLPNGHWQVFVIGTNKQAYSRWSSSSGVSRWASLGGQCIKPGQASIGMAWANKWNFAITCVGTNNKRYYNERATSGKWSGWRLSKY